MQTDVLIVGAGPVGLTCSLLLTQLGVSNQVIERRSGTHTAPQAHVVSARTMEVLHAAGIDQQRLRAIAAPAQDIGAVRWSLSLAGPDAGVFEFATPERILKIMGAGPMPPASISQNRLEKLLLQEVLSRGTKVVFDTQWDSASQSPSGVTSIVSATGGGAERRVESRFLLACDGAASRIRKASGIAVIGQDHVQTFVNVQLKANLRALVKDRPAILYWILDPAATGTLIAHDIDSSWVYMVPADAGPDGVVRIDEDDLRARVGRAIGAQQDFDIVSHDVWRMSAVVAERYRDGGVFLVGDAAHRFPPTGGMGLNTGVADAFNLAWKMAAVLHGQAGPGLLDSYEQERRPIAEQICAASLSNHLKMSQVVEALEIPAGADEALWREHIALVAQDPVHRARVQAAVHDQAEHFDMTGLDIGQVYEKGALVPDGVAPPFRANRVTDYVATGHPGARAPHLWLQIDGQAVALNDLVHPAALTLIAGPEAKGLEALAPLAGISVRQLTRDSCSAEALKAWLGACGISASGLLLVRPDQHVAWRGEALPTALGALTAAVLGGEIR